MIQNHLAFDPEELPRAVVGRNAEQNRLATALEPAVEGGLPEPALLSGPSGAGKTTVARATLRDLEGRHDVAVASEPGEPEGTPAGNRAVADPRTEAATSDAATHGRTRETGSIEATETDGPSTPF